MCLSSGFSCGHTPHTCFVTQTTGITALGGNTPQEGKVAGRKVFVDFNFGIEITGKNKGTKLGFGDPGGGTMPVNLDPQTWSLLQQLSDPQKAWRCP